MKCISTAPALVLGGLIWLAPSLSAEAATIVFLSDDPRCRRQQIAWDLSPAGIGPINLRLDPASTEKCEPVRGNIFAPFLGGGFGGGGGGGGIGGSSGGGLWGPTTGALASAGQFGLAPPVGLPDPPPFFDVDNSPTGDGSGGGGNDGTPGTTGFIGGGPGLPPDSSGLMYSFLLDADLPIPPGNISGTESLDDQDLAVVPEPGSFLLLGTGLLLAVRRLRRR